MTGDDVTIDDRAATPLALLFHELATNASKYGALATDTGRVTLTVTRSGDDVQLHWCEAGGPPVTMPETTAGFGTQLMELSAVRQLGGTVERAWRPEGLEVTVSVPAPAFSRAATAT